MTNQFSLESARNLTTEQLIAAMREGFALSEDGVLRACVSIAVLEEREVELPMLPEVYRYAREIAEGRLSPHAGLILGRLPFAIRAVLPLPLSLQDEIADGRKVRVAVKIEGRVSSRELTIYEMSQLQMRLAFSDEGIEPWERQGEFLHKASAELLGEAVPSSPKIRVDPETGHIIVGRTRLSVDDLLPALAALGYVVKPAYQKKKFAPARVR